MPNNAAEYFNGDIMLDGKPYRIDINSYRMRDVVDFSPRASTPGGSIIHSDLMLYQPLMQTDWRHGFGFQWYSDAMGYMQTRGDMDTRHEGVAMLYTKSTSSDVENYDKIGALTHKKVLYTWGQKGIRRYSNDTWSGLDFVTPKVSGTVASGQTTGLTSCTVNVTVPEEGANPALLVAVAVRDGSSHNVVSVTYNTSIKLHQIGVAEGTNPKVELWGTTDPIVGFSKQVEVTISSPDELGVVAIPLAYVDPTDPWGTLARAHSSSAGEASSVTVGDDELNDLIIDLVATKGNITLTKDTTQTELKTLNITTAGSEMSIGVSSKLGTGTATMAWTWVDEGTQDWAACTISIKASTSACSINTMFSNEKYLFICPKNGRIRRSEYSQTLTIQPNEVQGKDTYIAADAPTSTAGAKSKELLLGTTSNSGSLHRTSLIKFDLSTIPAGATIQSAVLSLYVNNKLNAPSISVNRILEGTGAGNWGESTATWNLPNKNNSDLTWGTVGCAKSGTDYSANEMYSGTPTAKKETHMKITLDLTEFLLMQADNYGMVIRDGATVKESYWEFASSSEAEDKSDHRPALILTYKLDGDWVDTGVDSNAKDFSWFTIHSGKIYAGERTNNLVHYSTTEDLSDLEGGTADTDKIVVGLGSLPTKGAISYASYLYLAREDGLWAVGDDNIARCVLDFSGSASAANFQSMVVYNGYLIFSIQDIVYQWNGARLTDITPQKLSDQFPYLTYGNFGNFKTSGNFLYCTARTNATPHTESLLCFDGVGWHSLKDLVNNTYSTVTTMLFFDPINYRLWYHLYKTSSDDTHYIPLQKYSNFPYAEYSTSVRTNYLLTSRLDMGFRRISKSCPSILVEASNLNQKHYIEIYYNLDGSAIESTQDGEVVSPIPAALSWKLWGTVATNGVIELSVPGDSPAVEFKYIQFKIVFITTESNQSPVLEGFTVRFLMRPEVAWGWNFNLPAADYLVYGESQMERTAHEIWSDLQEVRDSKLPVPFVDIDGFTYYVYIASMTTQAIERNVDTREDGIPSIERLVTINLVEAK